MKKEGYDVIIIGAGPAGMTAGLYSVRNGLKTLIISKDIGGTANSILLLENWPGFKGNGSELMKNFFDNLKDYDIEFVMSEVDSIKKSGEEFLVKTKKGEMKTKSIIIASGTDRRKLDVPGEKELTGKGVSYCVTCDAFFFKNKTVAVIGGSDCAAVSAVALSDLAKKTYLFYRGEKLRCEEINVTRLKKKPNVEIFYKSLPVKILGKDKVEGLVIKEDGKEKEIKLDGIFVEIGATPITGFTKELEIKMDKDKEIIVDDEMKTSVKGIFAAGDVTNSKLKQVVISSSQGAIAAKSAYEYLKK